MSKITTPKYQATEKIIVKYQTNEETGKHDYSQEKRQSMESDFNMIEKLNQNTRILKQHYRYAQ